ncbi:MAG: nucleotidyltransferase domain-containing protein [Anaerolineae bacterium]|nr:nucleotidyltransferase domain-containing protein [Anaerolineae bacterium]
MERTRKHSRFVRSNHTTQRHTTRERRISYKAASSRAPFKRVTRKQINAVVQRIVQQFNPEKVILFGSYAYGKPNIDSDVDLLVVMESDERPARRALPIVKQLLDVPFPMDVLVRTPQEIQQRLKMDDDFVHDIVEYGQVLYERRYA